VTENASRRPSTPAGSVRARGGGAQPPVRPDASRRVRATSCWSSSAPVAAASMRSPSRLVRARLDRLRDEQLCDPTPCQLGRGAS
jgi:hypothetical protein